MFSSKTRIYHSPTPPPHFTTQFPPLQATSETENVKEKPLTSKASAKNTVQIFPQEVKVSLRPKAPARFKIQFRQAEDYPVDLYYLMDLSNSMKDDKEKLADLGECENAIC